VSVTHAVLERPLEAGVFMADNQHKFKFRTIEAGDFDVKQCHLKQFNQALSLPCPGFRAAIAKVAGF
jgi:hypothetical protein